MDNRIMAKCAALVASVGMTLQLVPVTAFSADFTDVPGSHANRAAIMALQELGVIEGYDDGTFKPETTVNRAEFLKIILEARSDASFSGSDCFPDVKDEWFAGYICTAKSENIISGYPDGTYKPQDPVSFVEAGKILTLAYKQQTQGGSEWYEPYARALEASKAIPTSVNALDEKLTRGEMAEMMWRLRDGITDRPSKGYLNVKYPEMDVNTASDTVQIATSCEDLRAFTEEASKNNGRVDYYYGDGDVMMRNEAPAAVQDSGESANKSGDYSQTNIQVAGVDEGDIVKSDGEYLYIVNGQTVRIIKAVPSSNLQEAATIDFEDEGFTPNDLYIDGDQLIIIGNKWDYGGGDVRIMDSADSQETSDSKMMIWPGPWGMQKTEVRIYNVANASNPKIIRTVTFDGSTVSSRRIDDRLYLVMNQYPQYWGGPVPMSRSIEEDSLLPKFSDSAGNIKDRAVTDCAKVSILPHVPSPQYLMVGVIPVRNTSQKVTTDVVLGNAENIYASLNNLYIATTEWNYNWDSVNPESTQKTNIFRYDYVSDGVDLEAQGSVDGRILNQFSMDEHENHFRIATTIDSYVQGSTSSNNLFVMDMALKQTGAVEDIAPGERIYSVRFMGDRAYMVTFKQVDPLFVIDTSSPTNPKILGKLKIPGYSDYLHPYDENHVIGFGKEVDESINQDKVHTDDAVHYTAILGMKVALFDVSNVASPKEKFKVVIGDRGTESPLLYDHKALLFEKDRNLLAFPVSVMELPEGAKASDEFAYPTQEFQGAYMFNLTSSKGFEQIGRITQYTTQEMEKAGSYLYGKNVDRITRIDESLYTISQSGVQSNELDDGLTKEDYVEYTNNPVKDVVYPEER